MPAESTVIPNGVLPVAAQAVVETPSGVIFDTLLALELAV